MICPRCQNQLPDNSVACNRCGYTFFNQATTKNIQNEKKSIKKLVITLVSIILGSILLTILISLIIAYIPREIDYGDAKAFEQALNNRENVDGKIVKFKVESFRQPLAGYNLWAGEHLNFVSYRNPGVSTGDIIVIKVKRVQEIDGKWRIWYKKVKNGKETDNTIYSD